MVCVCEALLCAALGEEVDDHQDEEYDENKDADWKHRAHLADWVALFTLAFDADLIIDTAAIFYYRRLNVKLSLQPVLEPIGGQELKESEELEGLDEGLRVVRHLY